MMSAQADHCWGVRGALRVDGSPVHYRRSGPPGAPVVFLLHGSPESASSLHAIARLLETRFDVIGLDTPGNGVSASLADAEPQSADYAAHLLAVMDAFGVARAGLYGFHTGAGTAMSAALIAPERIAALALDGYAVWREDERARHLRHYCKVYPPVWDGSHLTQTWARLEEQLIFFPWYDRSLAARMALGPVDLSVRLRRLRDWLTAWESYVAPYRAAFARRGEDGPDRVACPTLIGAMARDPLDAHLDRLTDLSAQVRLAHWGEERPAALAEMSAHLTAHPGRPATKNPSDQALLASLAQPTARGGWKPDEHGGFLLAIWKGLREEAIARATTDAELDAMLDPLVLHAKLTAAIQAETGL